MKKVFIILMLVVLPLAGVRAALSSPDLVAQIHFAGARKISSDKNSSAFTNEFCSAEALALRAQTADKVSAWLAGWLPANVGVKVPSGAAKLRLLLDDLQTAEWFLEARAGANQKPEVAVAIKLEGDRAQLWQADLKLFFPAAGFKIADGWLFFESGTGAGKLVDGLARKISAGDVAWLSVDVNWPRLAQWYPKLKELGLPETQFAITAPDDNLRINGKFSFPEKLDLNLEPWRVPTNTLHPPFVSFTAARGFAAWLPAQSWALPYKILPAPNQAFVWALPQIPYQTFAVAPVADPANGLAQAFTNLQAALDQQKASGRSVMPLTLERVDHTISLQGVPFVAPYLQAVREPAGQFLLAGAFPNPPRGKPLPAELSQRLALTNLVLYHWEITAERLPQALNLSQLGLLMTSHRQLGGETASLKWFQKIAPRLGNSITEISWSGPAEMTFTRKSSGVFTAVELLVLGNWLEAADFPGFDLRLPPRPQKLRRPQPVPAPLSLPSPSPLPAK
ncbi:MAG: hypothetical protein WCH99_09635 [Verrucomicrobiota bacterium]